jgi:hypothetical protein
LGGCAKQLTTEHIAGQQQLADTKHNELDNAVHDESEQLRIKHKQPEQH